MTTMTDPNWEDWKDWADVIIFDDSDFSVESVRVEYDWESAARKIREAHLPDYLADRLAPCVPAGKAQVAQMK